MQKGFSMVVHSVMNSMEPPVSAEMSQIAKNLARIKNNKKLNNSTNSQVGTKHSDTEAYFIFKAKSKHMLNIKYMSFEKRRNCFSIKS